ncbi:MAG: glycosyltransferase family 2 protein [Nitrososphaerota archaeon]|nr:glycosyltransferase family 2 protein [Nitrososphaerota archaeon]
MNADSIRSRSPRYSLCITNYNTIETIERSINSLASQLKDQSEIVVVDNFSNDGSLKILRRFQYEGKIKLVLQKCNRGHGRQLAFEHSSGEYIIDQLDLDDIYSQCFLDLVRLYHRKFEGNLLLCHGFLIAPRTLLNELGGWRDLQWGEDRDLWARTASAGKFTFIPFDPRTYMRPHGGARSLAHRLMYQYERARDSYRIGINPAKRDSRATASSFFIRMLAVAGYIRSRFMKRYGQIGSELDRRKFIPVELARIETVKLEDLQKLLK